MSKRRANRNKTTDMASNYLELWPDDDRLLISVGTGAAPGPNVSGDLPDLCKAIAKLVSETEKTNEDFRDSHGDMIEKSRLFRFNVQQGLAGVGLDEHQHMGDISTHTMTYLNSCDTRREFDRCVIAMAESIHVEGWWACASVSLVLPR